MTHDTLVNESISVWAFFSSFGSAQTNLFPIAMNWRRRIIKFDKLVLATSKRVGQTKLINLICASASANYELEYNNETHAWKLKRVMPSE